LINVIIPVCGNVFERERDVKIGTEITMKMKIEVFNIWRQ